MFGSRVKATAGVVVAAGLCLLLAPTAATASPAPIGSSLINPDCATCWEEGALPPLPWPGAVRLQLGLVIAR